MFGQSWKIKKGTQWGTKKLLKKMGLTDDEAKRYARYAGLGAGALVALKTFDLVGAKAMIADEWISSTVEDSVADEMTSEATVAGGAVLTGATVDGQPTFGSSAYGRCARCGGDGLNYDHSPCWYCSGTGNA